MGGYEILYVAFNKFNSFEYVFSDVIKYHYEYSNIFKVL